MLAAAARLALANRVFAMANHAPIVNAKAAIAMLANAAEAVLPTPHQPMLAAVEQLVLANRVIHAIATASPATIAKAATARHVNAAAKQSTLL